MDVHSKFIQSIEKKLKETISAAITKPLQDADKEKQNFLKAVDNVKEISNKINSFMEKFDKIKDEMAENGKKFESY